MRKASSEGTSSAFLGGCTAGRFALGMWRLRRAPTLAQRRDVEQMQLLWSFFILQTAE